MVLTPELASYVGQGAVHEISAQKHGDLSRLGNTLGVALAFQFARFQSKEIRYSLDDCVDCKDSRILVCDVFQDPLGERQGDFFAGQASKSQQANQGTLQLT